MLIFSRKLNLFIKYFVTITARAESKYRVGGACGLEILLVIVTHTSPGWHVEYCGLK
jgi:hypothetical protein